MRIRSLSSAAVAGAALVLAVASAGHATVRPIVRTLAVPSRIALPPRPAAIGQARPFLQQTAPPASCKAATPGPEADDSSFKFSTNKGAATFGSANLAAAGYAGAFEGNGNSICDYNSVIAGGNANVIDSGSGNTPSVAAYAFIGAGIQNDIRVGESFIGAGSYNVISGTGSFIGAGGDDLVSAAYGFIGGGTYNTLSGQFDTVAGGGSNVVSADVGFIGGGSNNTVSGYYGTLGGGYDNGVAGSYALVGGGDANAASGEYATVLGGYSNKGSGEYATVAGGEDDTAAGELSFAGGYRADAAHNGSFVWSGYASGGSPLEDTAADQFVVRSAGGVYFYSNAGDTSGVKLGAGSGTWASLSDRNAKTDVGSLDDASILAKVAALPVSTWRYKSEKGVKHVGPMAQDFYAAFGVGEDNRHITSIDEDGVALAAIKALHRENAELRASQAALRSELRHLEAVEAPHLAGRGTCRVI